MRKQIAAANWKMNLSLEEGIELMNKILDSNIILESQQEAVFGVPFPYLINIKSTIGDKPNFYVAAQNCASEKAGAFTGETSAQMIKSIHVPYVIIGHSERREYYKETNEILAKKVNLAIENNLTAIFCCGESFEIRQSENQNEFVQKQLEESLFHLSPEEIIKTVIAYEPIWAIGTGLTASSQQAQEMHAHIRKVVADKYGNDTANTLSILYGGSVKAANAVEIFSQPDVDGGLVGGASLVANEFITIINSLKKIE
jgi:triosephosphate isomerase